MTAASAIVASISKKLGHIRVMGQPAVESGGQKWFLPAKALAAVALLAGHPDNHMPRQHLRDLLWGEIGREKANANLRQMLARVRKIEQQIGAAILLTEGPFVALNSAQFSTDLGDALAFDADAYVSKGQVQPLIDFIDGLPATILDGVTLSELAPAGWRDDMVAKLHHKAIGVLKFLVTSKSDQSNTSRLERLAHRLVEFDRCAEAGYRMLMSIYDQRGDRAQALRIYQACRKALREELGAEPEAATRRLAAALGFVEFARALESPRATPRDPRAVRGGERGDAQAPVSAKAGQPQFGVPRIALLPPMLAVADETTARLARAFVEDVVSGLSRFRSFAVLAPHTSFQLLDSSGRPNPHRQIPYDYAMSSSIKPSFSGLAAGFRLTDDATGEVLWASEWEFSLDNLPHLFSQVCHQIIYSLVTAIESAERRFPFATKNASAYRLYLEGRAAMSGTGLQGLRAARNFFKKSVGYADDFAPALAGISRTLSMERIVRGLTDDGELLQAISFADRATAFDPYDGRGMRERGFASLYLRRHEESLASFQRATELNPSDADLLADYADALAHSGQPAEALDMCRRAISLNALCPDYYYWILGSIHYQMEDFGAALEALEPVKENPETARLMAAASARAGQPDQARSYAAIVRETYPEFRLDLLAHIVPDKYPKDTNNLIDGLRQAGLE